MICEAFIDEDDPFDSTFKVVFSTKEFSDLDSLDLHTRNTVINELRGIAKENLNELHSVRMSKYS